NMSQYIGELQNHGIALTAEVVPRTAFGFIHGMWALDNSRGNPPNNCGVDIELSLLRMLGCYADYTFPAWGWMNPNVTNAIFYARDDADRKSYGKAENIRLARVGEDAWGDLLLFLGPDEPPPSSEWANRMVPDALDAWVGKNIHVEGNDDWVFVKIHCHGIQQRAVGEPNEVYSGVWGLWGEGAERFWSYAESEYNDGVDYRLHYVSAREAYNIVRAAQAGMVGNPDSYRDFEIPPYVHQRLNVSAPYRLEEWSRDVVFSLLDDPPEVTIRSRAADARSLVYESPDGITWFPFDGDDQIADGVRTLYDSTPSRSYTWFLSGPEASLIGPVFPNPGHQGFTIHYRVGTHAHTRVDLFNVLGRHIKMLVDGNSPPGEFSVSWDGTSDSG
ncbi:MAG: hypothetical protein GY851_13070, partial [bacterium]|nr:hypothetical protein [bacterium]